MELPKIYNINAGESFVDVLARRYLEKFAYRPAELANVLFLLPNRRACQSLADAFVRQHNLQPTILPQIKPIFDVEEDEVVLTQDAAILHNLLPAVDPIRKAMQFTRMIMKKSELGLDKISPAQAYTLAKNLMQLMDMSYNQELDLAKLKDLAGEEYAIHWKQTLLLLQIITENWPNILAQNGKTDEVARRHALLRTQMQIWQQQPTTQNIVVAGTTAAFPIIKELVQTVLSLPNGEVYLYGLDKCLDDASWNKTDENHPQFELKELLDFLKISRASVEDIGTEQASKREQIVAEIMRPAETSAAWRDLPQKGFTQTDFAGIKMVNCDDLRQEAEAIALIIRHTLETPEKTAALVTMDRDLSRRVVSELQKWNINADDSAGRPLALTPIGIYLRQIWDCVETSSQTAYIALMKHPFTACGYSREEFNKQVRALELSWRQGQELKDHTVEFWNLFKAKLQPLTDLYLQPAADFAQIFKTHIATAENLADTDTKTGAQIIWREDAGSVAAKWVSDFADKSSLLGTIKTNDYSALLTTLLSEQSVRKRYGTHPRIKILGPIEARLTQYDVTIIGEVNEGTWPNQQPADMWMSRNMKKNFGLPLPERQIGVMAADFAHLMNAPQVYLTRAKKVDGNPVNKSRWWLRFETILEATFGTKENALAFIYDQPYAAWAKCLDRSAKYQPIKAPEPRPKLERRPREMSATNIEKWMRDPYFIYAKYILSLRKLDDLDTPKQPYDFGNIVHKVLEEFNRQYNTAEYPEPAEARQILHQLGAKEFAANSVPEEISVFWLARFTEIVEWLVNKEQSYRPQIAAIKNEVTGFVTLPGIKDSFKITAKADRIDILQNGMLNIIDYKTGQDQSIKAMVAGKAPQLPIEGIIAQSGGFADVAAAPINSLQYWAFKSTFNATDAEQSEKAMTMIKSAVQRLINAYDNENQPYLVKPRPSSAQDYSDYDHLARLKEWGTHSDKDENYGGE